MLFTCNTTLLLSLRSDTWEQKNKLLYVATGFFRGCMERRTKDEDLEDLDVGRRTPLAESLKII
jgi:hypothetical protein